MNDMKLNEMNLDNASSSIYNGVYSEDQIANTLTNRVSCLPLG